MLKLSELGRFYLISFTSAAILWTVLLFLDFEFVNITFFIMAYLWNLALLTPGLREKILTSAHKFSFISVVVRINYYLQLFIPAYKIPMGEAMVRTLSPLTFTFLLFVAGGTGNMFFTLLGSAAFEVIYFLMNRKSKVLPSDPEIQKESHCEESVHE